MASYPAAAGRKTTTPPCREHATRQRPATCTATYLQNLAN